MIPQGANKNRRREARVSRLPSLDQPLRTAGVIPVLHLMQSCTLSFMLESLRYSFIGVDAIVGLFKESLTGGASKISTAALPSCSHILTEASTLLLVPTSSI